MKRIFALTVVLLTALCLISAVGAQQIEKSAKRKVGIDWYEKVMRERAIKERAAEERNAMKQAAKGKEDAGMAGLTIDAYNASILKKNATKLK